MFSNADVVIVGAGVIGASVAWHLASLGVRKVVLVERRAAPGEGSTLKATGGFRATFGTQINVRLSLLSREKLVRFRDEVGVDSGYRPCGYLWIARTEAQLAELRAANEVQRAAGLHEARCIDSAEIARSNPAVRADGITGGVFCPTDGFIRAAQILRGYLEGAQRLGATVLYKTPLRGFRKLRDGRIAAALTTDGELPAGCVVNAAGPWAAEVAHLAGIELPVSPLRRQVAPTDPCTLLPEDMPMTVFVEDGFHLRVRDGRALLLLPTPGNVRDPHDVSVEDAWVARVAKIAAERVPCLASVPIDRARCWGGLYEMSPDKHAILGPASGCENLFLINGSSGHGVMHAPALGQILAEMIVHGRARSLDARALRPPRFTEGESNSAPVLL